MNLKKKNTLIKSLIAQYTLTIEYKQHKTKELKNKSTIDEKNLINSKKPLKQIIIWLQKIFL